MARHSRSDRKRAAPAPFASARRHGRDWLILGLILLAGAGLRGAYLAELVNKPDYDSPLSDAKYNDYWARALATGDWTPPRGETDPEIPTTPYFRPPGYTWFLAAIYWLAGGSYLAPRLVQMALGLASCVLGCMLARGLFGRGAGLIAAALLAAYWGCVYFEGDLQPPALLVFLTLVLLNVLRLWAGRPSGVRALLIGLVVGLFALVRANILLFAPVLLLWMAWVLRRRTLLRRWPLTALATVAAMLLAICPATIRNYRVGGEFVLISTNGGVNLYIGNNEHTSLVTPRIPDIEQLAGRSGWNLFDYPLLVRGVEKRVGRPMTHAEVSRYFSRRALAFVRSHPGTALGYALRRAALLWGPREVSNDKVLHFERRNSPLLRFLPDFPVALSGFVLGLVLLLVEGRVAPSAGQAPAPERRAGAEIVVAMLLFAAVYSASFVPFLVAGRYRLPVAAVLLLPAAYALRTLGSWVRARRFVPAACGVAGWVVLWAAAHWQIEPYRPDPGRWHLDRATAYNQKGDVQRAIAEYQAAIRANPTFPDTYAALGSLLATEGRFDEAIANYRRAIEINPAFAELRRKLALMLDQLDRLDEAIAEYRAALAISPDNGEAWYALGRALTRKGEHEQAIAAFRRSAELTPAAAEPHVNIGRLLQARGDLVGAIREYQRALEANPNLFEAHFNLASALSAQGRLDEAMRELSTALHIRPDDPRAQAALKALQTEMQRRRAAPAGQPPQPRP